MSFLKLMSYHEEFLSDMGKVLKTALLPTTDFLSFCQFLQFHQYYHFLLLRLQVLITYLYFHWRYFFRHDIYMQYYLLCLNC